jgi:hypothetical protein
MRRLTRPAVAALAAAALTAVLAPTAQAGTMTTHTCRLPDGRPAATTGWSGFSADALWELRDTCATAGHLAMTPKGPGHSSDEAPAILQYTPAPDTVLHGVSVQRAALLPYTPQTWGWSYSIGAGSYVIEANSAAQGPGGNGSLGAGTYVAWNGAGNTVSFSNPAVLGAQNALRLGMRCAGEGGRTCADPAGNAFLRLYQASIITYDGSDPAVENVGGSLLSPGPKDGTETLTYNASDTGSGLYRAIVDVDGRTLWSTVLDGNGGRCADVDATNNNPYEFGHRQPCKLAINSGEVSIDTRALAEGERSVRVRIEDATGNHANVFGPMPVMIDNIPAPKSTSAPIVSGPLVRGSVLSTDAGGWDGNGVPVSLAYQWQRSADDGATWADIPGATGATYTLGSGDVGRQIRSRVTATSSEGTTTAYSATAGRVKEPGAPTTLPPDSAGTPGADGKDGKDGRDGGTTTIIQTGNGRDASPAATLAAVVDGTRSKSIRVRYGQKRRITGTLRLPNGQPIVGARLDVITQPKLMGALPLTGEHVVTDSRGRFAYQLKATSSRTVTFGYRWYTEAASFTHRTTVTVDVIPSVSMKPSRPTLRNGQSVSFAGAIKGAPRGVRKVVEIQALDGRRWRTIATVRVSKSRTGKFSYRYRFTRTTRPTVYRFRATVKAERGWPFLTGRSAPRTVKVRP